MGTIYLVIQLYYQKIKKEQEKSCSFLRYTKKIREDKFNESKINKQTNNYK